MSIQQSPRQTPSDAYVRTLMLENEVLKSTQRALLEAYSAEKKLSATAQSSSSPPLHHHHHSFVRTVTTPTPSPSVSRNVAHAIATATMVASQADYEKKLLSLQQQQQQLQEALFSPSKSSSLPEKKLPSSVPTFTAGGSAFLHSSPLPSSTFSPHQRLQQSSSSPPSSPLAPSPTSLLQAKALLDAEAATAAAVAAAISTPGVIPHNPSIRSSPLIDLDLAHRHHQQRAQTIIAEKRAEELESTLETKNADIEHFKKLIAAGNSRIIELEKSLASRLTPEEREALEVENARLRLQLEGSREVETQLRAEIRDLQLDKTSLKRSVQDVQDAQHPSPLIIAELTRLQKELQNKEEQLTAAKIQIQDANSTISKMGREVDILRTEMRQANGGAGGGGGGLGSPFSRSKGSSSSSTGTMDMRTLEGLYRDKRAECAALQTELVETKGKLLLLQQQGSKTK